MTDEREALYFLLGLFVVGIIYVLKIFDDARKIMIYRLLHWLPFTHFYGKWSDTDECRSFGGDERQQRFCIVCNKKQYRTVNNFTLLDK